MKVLVTADVHIHNGPYENSLALGRQLLWDLIRLAESEKCAGIIIAGDLWHQKHATPVEVLLLIREWMEELEHKNITLWWIRGNHECQSRTNPEESLMKLFMNEQGIHQVIVETAINSFPAPVCGHFVPWYPTEIMKKELNRVHEFALKTPKAKHILFAHCGLREGKVSADGFKVPKDLSVKDLQPGLYSFVLLGDYHGHQFLADNVLYVGEPVERTFGSFDSVGVWLLDISGDEVQLESLRLPSRYPQFLQCHIGTEDDLGKVLDSFDRHRITCPASLLPRVVDRYPFAEVIGIDEKTPGDIERNPKVYLSNHEEVLREYVSRHYPKESKDFYARARKYLKEGLCN